MIFNKNFKMYFILCNIKIFLQLASPLWLPLGHPVNKFWLRSWCSLLQTNYGYLPIQKVMWKMPEIDTAEFTNVLRRVVYIFHTTFVKICNSVYVFSMYFNTHLWYEKPIIPKYWWEQSISTSVIFLQWF